MAVWKWGLASVPALSGFAVGIQQLSGSSTEESSVLNFYDFDEGNPDKWESETEDLEEEKVDTKDLKRTLQFKGSTSETKDNLEKVKAEATSALQKLDDYTFKLFSPCNTGTGWILDYQLPEKTGDYPLIWYIATNAHVVKGWLFDQKNTYDQKLPWIKKGHNSNLLKNKSNDQLFARTSCDNLKKKGIFDINLSKQSDGRQKGSDKGAISQNKMKSPKLFWAAVDLFNKDNSMDISSNNYKDFAVVEIEFTNEKSAREITRNFADKYKVGSADVINVFADPLDSSATETNEDNFYTLGYPFKKNDRFGYSQSLNTNTLVSDRLERNYRTVVFNAQGKRESNPKGYIGTKTFSNLTFKWGGGNYQRMGHFYLMTGKINGKGSSGSMYIDGKGNLLGVKSIVSKMGWTQNSMITPLRSKEMKINGHFKTPEYDLILGAKKQKSSYKSQVEKYLVKKGKKTWLSQRKGWDTKLQTLSS